MNATDKQGTCDCRDLLQLVLDGQATAAELDHFREHLNKCPECFGHYEVDSAVVDLLKKKCCGGPAPEDLVTRVRSQLNLRDQ